MKSGCLKWGCLISVVLIGGCVVSLVSWLTPPYRHQHYVAQFNASVSKLDELRLMILQDTNVHFIALEPRREDEDDKLTAGRLQKYHELLRTAEVNYVYHDEDDIGFGIAEAGGIDSGWSLSYVCCGRAPTNVVRTWAQIRHAPEGRTYLPIASNWYFRMVREVAHF